MSSTELGRWRAYVLQRGPLGPVRGDYQAAGISHTVAMVNRGKKGRKPRFVDFLLSWGRQGGGRRARDRALGSGDERFDPGEDDGFGPLDDDEPSMSGRG